jgi:hypothetical protein
MNAKSANLKIIGLQPREISASKLDTLTALHAQLLSIENSGILIVRSSNDNVFSCDWLESSATAGIKLEPGDRLLVVPPSNGENGVVLGRIGRYHEPKPEPNVIIEASETLTLKCGEASVDLRNDGKVMVRGEDVLLRAKGTQRIRAGTVAIN